jgi:hypothetical protein
MLRLRLCVLIAVVSFGASLQAEPMRPFVDRAKYILHLEVVGIEEPTKVAEKDGENLTYGPEYAVCDVKDILLGMVASDRDGYVRVACVSRKNTRHDAGEVRYEVGDEFTLIADTCELSPRKGMTFPVGSHANSHPAGKPSKELRELIYNRVERANALAEALEKLIPGATAEVQAVLDEFEQQSRDDFKDVSAEADLLLDLVAVSRYTPDLADLPRPALDESVRAKHMRLALRAVCDLSAEGAEIAAALVEGSGHGVYGLLKPARVADDKALAELRKLADGEQFDGVVGHLLRNDFEQRALAWISKLAMDSGPTAELAQWALIEAVEGGWVEFGQADQLLAPERSTALPYDNASQRAVAGALDKRATRLAAWLVIRQGAALKASEKVAASAGIVDAHTKKAAELYGAPEMLQVYAYALAVQGADAQHVADARAQIEKKRSDKLDLKDISAVEWELKKKNILPDAVRRVVKTQRR